MKEQLNSWKRELTKAIKHGRGRYKNLPAHDIFQCLEFIKLIKCYEWRNAYNMWDDLERNPKIQIPSKIRMPLIRYYENNFV